MKRVGKALLVLLATTISLVAFAKAGADYAMQWPLTLARDGDETSQVPEADASRLLRDGRGRTERGMHH